VIRIVGGGLLGLLLVGLWLYCIFDVIASDAGLVRNLPKGAWLLIVVLLPDIGSIAWLALGRPQFARWRPGDTGARAPRRAIGPEDLPSFPTSARPAPGATPDERLQAWEDDLHRREEELRRRQDDAGDDPGSAGQ